MTILHLPKTTEQSKKLLSIIDTVLLNLSGVPKNIYKGISELEKELVLESSKEVNEISLNELKNTIQNMLILELVLAFRPDEKVIDRLHNWARENVSKNILLSVKTDPKIVGGTQITFEGKYTDLSVVKKLEEALKPVKHE